MSAPSKSYDQIAGLVDVILIPKAETTSGRSASLAVLRDGDAMSVLDLAAGLDANHPGLTRPMKSYLTGLTEVGAYLKARTKTDEDGVSEDDIERAAIAFAFPRVARDSAALDMIKAHLDALQAAGVLPKISAGAAAAGAAAAKPEPAPAPQPEPLKLEPAPAPAEAAAEEDTEEEAEEAVEETLDASEEDDNDNAEAKDEDASEDDDTKEIAARDNADQQGNRETPRDATSNGALNGSGPFAARLQAQAPKPRAGIFSR